MKVLSPVAIISVAMFANNIATSMPVAPTMAKSESAPDARLLNPPHLQLSVAFLPVTTLDGKLVDIGAQPGWRVVYFWSAECPCVTACEDYTLRPMAELYAGRVAFYAVDAGGYDLGHSVGWLKREAASGIRCHILCISTAPTKRRRR
jgi:hypothetical protein